MNRRRLGLLMTTVGAGMTLVGVVGLLRAGPSAEPGEPPSAGQPVVTTSSQAPTTTPPSTPVTTGTRPPTPSTPTSSTTSSTTSTVAEPAETVEGFVDQFVAAIENGDVEFLLGRLHPAVVGGYGPDLCRSWIEDEILWLSDYRLTGEVTGPFTQSFTTAAGTGVIEDAFSAPVSFSFQGQTFDSTGGFALVEGHMHWLGQCR